MGELFDAQRMVNALAAGTVDVYFRFEKSCWGWVPFAIKVIGLSAVCRGLNAIFCRDRRSDVVSCLERLILKVSRGNMSATVRSTAVRQYGGRCIPSAAWRYNAHRSLHRGQLGVLGQNSPERRSGITRARSRN